MMRHVPTAGALTLTCLVLAACGGSETPSPPVGGESTTEPATAEQTVETETEAATTAEETETIGAETEMETETETETETGSDGGDDSAFRVTVEAGVPVGGVQSFAVKKGDDVRIVVRVDEPQEVHLHGYDVSQVVEPGSPGVFELVAEFEGVFELELEETAVEIATLTVEP
jgi:hypothetical protein